MIISEQVFAIFKTCSLTHIRTRTHTLTYHYDINLMRIYYSDEHEHFKMNVKLKTY